MVKKKYQSSSQSILHLYKTIHSTLSSLSLQTGLLRQTSSGSQPYSLQTKDSIPILNFNVLHWPTLTLRNTYTYQATQYALWCFVTRWVNQFRQFNRHWQCLSKRIQIWILSINNYFAQEKLDASYNFWSAHRLEYQISY